ncbi:hypothetical protein H7H48_02290 [Nitratireductor sp. B36]|uniref:hypothetical protein n=1 Tax=Nitratireductor sp. B36 TaxID=2762059 RepID=UPI001E40E2F1|nr:hypothetical protein [Nitratireductor sp. B36]MCC5777866.1 hypothetical protein [Nitratireductor sp. B36]
MPQLVEQKVDIGRDAYGRRVTATRKHTYDGKTVWDIRSEPMDQRDEGERMSGLSDDNIRELVQALDLIKG